MNKLKFFLIVLVTWISVGFMSVSSTSYAGQGIVHGDFLDTPIRGIDVSDWQRDIDWYAVKRAGIQFAMIRCGWSDDGVDGKFDQNVRNARAAGVKIGTYLYSYAGSVAEARSEAEHCLRIIRRFPAQYFEYPVVFDIEEEGEKWSIPKRTGYNKRIMTDMVRTFCRTIEGAGYYASFYANPNWLNNYLYGAELMKDFDLWLAHWGVASPSRRCGLWQYTSSGRVSGISGNVDMDYAYYNYPEHIRYYHCNGF